MSQAFEKVAVREIDDLYRQALFLRAGDEVEAERLLLDALSRAFRNLGQERPDEEPRRWFQRRMIRDFLAEVKRAAAARPPLRWPWRGPFSALEIGAASGPEGVDADALFRAAGRLPPPARAAIWLVVFARWSYAEAAEALGTNLDELRELMAYRHGFMADVMRTARAGPIDGEMAV
ncbi:MAG: hypothetical protein GWM92_05930 [Gemmatimonadetes bacterium]|nr:hypothetical protein [Gemmatimonadota bacterium]NIT86705.1 hypothetical protein [Gemmatimonadota bacterium]NIU30564.1 hypothetical protein [Gemmatimonadota bacterium]NIU35402.1 hypothetical protein [Gemmatimonadota bacterium]NIV60931.1 hypothetical protein [Gemmatimonadota bacterium]